jgi:hypothetical protein
MVREPVDRVLSRYFFALKRSGASARADVPPTCLSLILRTAPELGHLYDRYGGGAPTSSEMHGAVAALFNGQARSLLEPSFDTSELAYTHGPGSDADVWRTRLRTVLADYGLVGAQERFAEFAEALRGTYGLPAGKLPSAKRNPQRPATSEVPGALRDKVGAYNWLDAELHAWIADAGGLVPRPPATPHDVGAADGADRPS